MTTTTKTPVQIIQELISLQSAKIEKLNKTDASAQQSVKHDDPTIKKLLNELSQFGDAVDSTVAKDDPYYEKEKHSENDFQQAINRVIEQAGELPESLQSIIQSLKN